MTNIIRLLLPIVLVSCLFGPSFRGNCVPRALYQGAAWQYWEGLRVRFIVREVRPGCDHIQCQVFYDRNWRYSKQDGDIVLIGTAEFPNAEIKKNTYMGTIIGRAS